MTDDRALKPVFGKTYEQTSYKVTYETDTGRFFMYVWADDNDDAKRQVLRRESQAVIRRVEVGRPEEKRR